MMDSTSVVGLEKPLTVFKNKKTLNKRVMFPYIYVSEVVDDLMDANDGDITTEQIETIVKDLLIKEAYSEAKTQSDTNLQMQGQENVSHIKDLQMKLSELPYFKALGLTKDDLGTVVEKDENEKTDTNEVDVTKLDGLNKGVEGFVYDNDPSDQFKDNVKKAMRLDDPKEKGGKFLATKAKRQKAADDTNLDHKTIELGNDIEFAPPKQKEDEDKKKSQIVSNLAFESKQQEYIFESINFDLKRNSFFTLIPEAAKIDKNIFEMTDMCQNKLVIEWSGDKNGTHTILSETNLSKEENKKQKMARLFAY